MREHCTTSAVSRHDPATAPGSHLMTSAQFDLRPCTTPDQVERCELLEAPDPRYGEFGLRFNRALGAIASDAGCNALAGNAAHTGVILAGGPGPNLDWCGLPVRPPHAVEYTGRGWNQAFLSALSARARAPDRDVVVIESPARGSELSDLEGQVLSLGASVYPSVRAEVDLGEVRERGRVALRKSFKSLVNWGRREMRVEVIGARNPDRELFARIREFHTHVAGRVTRPEASWDVQFEALAAGRGEAVVGFLPGAGLVSANVCIDGASRCLYWSGIYDRSRFDSPLAHWPLYHAIERAAARGLAVFDLGDIPLRADVSTKEFTIGQFKKGFASALVCQRAWHMPVAPE